MFSGSHTWIVLETLWSHASPANPPAAPRAGRPAGPHHRQPHPQQAGTSVRTPLLRGPARLPRPPHQAAAHQLNSS